MIERRRRVFPEAFKRDAVERMATSGQPIVRVAEELGLHETVLRRWMSKYSAEGTAPQRRPTTQAAAPSLADLASENARTADLSCGVTVTRTKKSSKFSH